MKELDQGYEFTKAQLAELEQLRQRVKELEEYHEAYRQEVVEGYGELLAASQLDNLRLRSALEKALHWTSVGDMSLFSRYSAVVDTLRDIEELSTPTDTEALEEYLADRLGDPMAYSTCDGYLLHADDIDSCVFKIAIPLYALKEKP